MTQITDPVVEIPKRLHELWQITKSSEFEVTAALSVLSYGLVFVWERLGYGQSKHKDVHATTRQQLLQEMMSERLDIWLEKTNTNRVQLVWSSGFLRDTQELKQCSLPPRSEWKVVPSTDPSNCSVEYAAEIVRHALAHGAVMFEPQFKEEPAASQATLIKHIIFVNKKKYEQFFRFVEMDVVTLQLFTDTWLRSIVRLLDDNSPLLPLNFDSSEQQPAPE